MQEEQGIFSQGKVILIDKPLTWTSFDVVNKIRYTIKKYEQKKKVKVGHAGTLDPLATGLLILCSGKMTKQIEDFQGQEKEYIAKITFGFTTASYDLESDLENQKDVSALTLEKIETALKDFQGEIDQVPPIFSAVQVNGKRAYKSARQGEKIELKARKVTISELEILDSNLSENEAVISLRIVCSKGTYIRSLAHDLGQKLETGAHLSGLQRTKIGEFKIEDAQSIEQFLEEWKPKEKLD
ncbi:tRNA pseudouridine 55 synthase [Bernardetia litoralis DSM 6794]|uniref:tRNA pseudouridine synthase B n=1 Tax=Bernardetia litoralis (strain ATCC 23117 / DSM 6794 / NBRC 15988 / NCIMB 1366 / Fx l1 / Sio-4) TaxID=880071 RepID=I4AI36_BERLS|nr:tRNA pseudouridine(55) synthase TruB [Bernardetia litoralis]AFM03621.1 tRNA pseudouridine 55 synthase [Bernardetia litoralis DSM 6794]